MGCFLGVAVALSAEAKALGKAYGNFRQEALALNPDYRPKSVNTDGWEGTQKAWKTLFPEITLILCFLHVVLGIQKRCRRSPAFHLLSDKLWHLYESWNRREFSQRLRRLCEWASAPDTMLPEAAVQKVLGLKAKAAQLRVTFALPQAARTSNQVDRLINYQDRILYAMQYFHGSLPRANQALRAMALLWNFHPYCRKVQVLAPHRLSPFEDLNGFRYHDHWLRNLLIASSLNGRGTAKPNKHKLE